MRPAVLPLLALAPALAASSARAEPPRVAIELTFTQGPAASCLDEQGFKREVVERVGCDPFQPSAPLRLEASVARRRGEFVATIVLRDETGRMLWDDETLHDPNDCAGVVKAMAFVLARELYRWPKAWVCPPAPAELPPPPEPPKPPPAPASVPAPPPPVVKAPPAPPKRNVAIHSGADAVFNPFAAPSVSLGFAPWAGVRLRDPGISIEAGMRAMWSVKATAATNAKLYRWTYASGVVAVSVRRSFFFAGLVLEGGTLSPQADHQVRGVDAPAFVAVGARAGVERSVADLFTLRASIEGEYVPLRARLQDNSVPAAVLWAMPLFSTTIAAGMAFRVW
jgi:hypothetical protein